MNRLICSLKHECVVKSALVHLIVAQTVGFSDHFFRENKMLGLNKS